MIIIVFPYFSFVVLGIEPRAFSLSHIPSSIYLFFETGSLLITKLSNLDLNM